MPLLSAQSLTYCFENGEVLFEKLSFSIDAGITALVGCNGAGKSILAQLLAGRRLPSTGGLLGDVSVGYYQQLTSLGAEQASQSLAAFLGIDASLAALARISAGSCAQADYELVGDDWHIQARYHQLLQSLGIAAELTDCCAGLSGGELSRPMLWQLLQAENELLILDEPGNHLDAAGKQWLIAALEKYSGAVLLISHDRQLLRCARRILSLSSLGLETFHGNYDAFEQQRTQSDAALARQCLSSCHKIT